MISTMISDHVSIIAMFLRNSCIFSLLRFHFLFRICHLRPQTLSRFVMNRREREREKTTPQIAAGADSFHAKELFVRNNVNSCGWHWSNYYYLLSNNKLKFFGQIDCFGFLSLNCKWTDPRKSMMKSTVEFQWRMGGDCEMLFCLEEIDLHKLLPLLLNGVWWSYFFIFTVNVKYAILIRTQCWNRSINANTFLCDCQGISYGTFCIYQSIVCR